MSTGDVRSISVSLSSRYRDLRPMLWTFGGAWVATLAFLGVGQRHVIASRLVEMLGWVVLGAVVNLLPLEGWQSAPFAADDAIVLAAAIVFHPVEAALITFVAAFDPREFRRQISLSKSLGNRSQLSFCWFVGSLIVHHLSADPQHSVAILPLAFVVLSCSSALNYGLVSLSLAWERRYRFAQVVPKMKIGISLDFLLVFLAWGVLGAMLIVLYGWIGRWALLAFVAPVLLSRQALQRSQGFMETTHAYRSREHALAELSKQIDHERGDERKLIAADLHDEVLQPLFKVMLMAQVLRREVAEGQLAQVNDDIEELLSAADLTTTSLRSLIGDLRRPGLGRGGLGPALARLAEVLKEQTKAQIHTRIQSVETDSERQLAMYQVAKEAITNAVHHSGAGNIWLELRMQDSALLLTVKDDGKGFDSSVERAGHYGLLIMRERTNLAGGHLYVDSTPGFGCVITAAVPIASIGPDEVGGGDA